MDPGHPRRGRARQRVPPHRVLRAGHRCHAGGHASGGHRGGQRRRLRAHLRDPDPGRHRAGDLARGCSGRKPLCQPWHHRGHRAPPALRRLEALGHRLDDEGRRSLLPAGTGGHRARRRPGREGACGPGHCGAGPSRGEPVRRRQRSAGRGRPGRAAPRPGGRRLGLEERLRRQPRCHGTGLRAQRPALPTH